MNIKNLLVRIIFYCIGLFFLAVGVVISVNSGLGVSPVNSLPYVISLISKVDLGTMVVLVFSFYIFLQMVILRSEFRWINLSQIIFSSVFGYFVDFAGLLIGSFNIPTYLGSLLMLMISIFFIALGVVIYVGMGLINMPMEGLVDAIQKRFLYQMSFADVKVRVDSTVLIIGGILSLVFLGGLVGVREGTVLSALLVGKAMAPIKKRLEPMLMKIRVYGV